MCATLHFHSFSFTSWILWFSIESEEMFLSDISELNSATLRPPCSFSLKGPRTETVKPLKATQMVSPGINLPDDLVDLPNLDLHFIHHNNCARHLLNDIVGDIQDVESFKLSQTLVYLLENEFLNGSPVDHEPLEDISLRSKNTLIEGPLLLEDHRDILEEGMVPALKRDPGRRARPFSHGAVIMPRQRFMHALHDMGSLKRQNFLLDPWEVSFLSEPLLLRSVRSDAQSTRSSIDPSLYSPQELKLGIVRLFLAARFEFRHLLLTAHSAPRTLQVTTPQGCWVMPLPSALEVLPPTRPA